MKTKKTFAMMMAMMVTSVFTFAQTWTTIPSGSTSNLKSVHFPTSTIGYASGDNGTILKTTNGGTSWTSLTSSYSGYWFWDVHFINADTGFVCGESDPGMMPSGTGIIIKTTNGGTSWTSCLSGSGVPIRDLFVINQDTIIACGGAEGVNSRIIKSVDGGASWNPIGPTYFDAMLGGLYFANSNKGFLGVYESVYGTFNPTKSSWLNTIDGSTFSTVISSSLGYWDFSTDFPTAITGYMMRSTYTSTDAVYIRKTVDGGVNWIETAIPAFAGSTYGLDFFDANNGYVVGGSGLIKNTTNGGVTWSTQISGTTEDLHSVYFVNAGLGFAVGNNGKILKWTSATTGIENQNLATLLNNIFPNPTSGEFTIVLPTDDAEITVLNALGQEVIKKQAIQNTTQLQLDENGVYLVYITTKDGTTAQKLIVNR